MAEKASIAPRTGVPRKIYSLTLDPRVREAGEKLAAVSGLTFSYWAETLMRNEIERVRPPRRRSERKD